MPGLEAHGGYTFCGTAALVILGNEQMLDLRALLVRKMSRESPVFSGAAVRLGGCEVAEAWQGSTRLPACLAIRI